MTPAQVAAVIERNGQTVTIAGAVTQSYNTTTGAVTNTASYNATAKAVPLPLQAYRKVGQTNIVAGDETLLLAAVDTAGAAMTDPPVDATVTLADGSKRTLVAVDPLRPAGTTLIFDCVMRGHA